MPSPLPDADGVVGTVSATVVYGDTIACDDPGERERSGPLVAVGDPWAAANDVSRHASGLGVGDFDDDGYLDVFMAEPSFSAFYRGGAGGTFSPWALAHVWRDVVGASVVDVEGDGDLDVFAGALDGDVLLRNEGGKWVVDEDSGIAADTGYTTASAWDDIDGDGDLDLFVGRHTSASIMPEDLTEATLPPSDPKRLFRNEGEGTFTDLSAALPEVVQGAYVYAASFLDLDGEGGRDLYVVDDFGPQAVPNLTLLNRRGYFEEATRGLEVSTYGMGLGVGDLNGDRVADLLVSTWDGMILLESRAGGWTETALARGLDLPVGDRHVAWGNDLADLDNDGDLDALVAFGALDEDDGMVAAVGYENPAAQPDGLWLQEEDGQFVERSAAWGVDDPGRGQGFVLADFNRDGWLDLVLRNHDTPATLYLSNCGEEAWLTVELRQADANPFAIGAVIDVEAGDLGWRRWMLAGGTNLASGGPPEQHFGLGTSEVVDITVTWPDGETSRVEGVESRRRVRILREDGVAEGDAG